MKKLTLDQIKSFKEQGVLVIDDYVDLDLCQSIVEDIEKLHAKEKLIVVNSGNGKKSFFSTINGKNLIEASGVCLLLRDKTLEMINRYIDSKIVNISNMKIGVSLNRTPVGGKFVKHFDRNKITAVIYLTECVGGEMICHPRSRFLLPGRYLFGIRYLQKILDVIILSSIYKNYFIKKITIIPKPGRVVFFEGNRTLHGVQCVHENSPPRYSLQLAYDFKSDLFNESNTHDYYGNN